MQNIGMEEFSYDSFKMAYDSDEVIQALTYRFDQNGVELVTKNKTDKPEVGKKTGGDTLKTAAMRSTNKHLG